MNSSTAALITCSYSGDLDVCRLLCRSIDQFVPQSIGHTLYVPRRDIPLFLDLASSRRTLAAQEDLLPQWFWKAPLPSPIWRKRLRLPRRNVYFTPYSRPVRGWIAQQIMKIAATTRSASEIVAHVDSDCAFVRPVSLSHFISGGKVRLYANPDFVREASHEPWYEAAAKLLGLPPGDYFRADYIDQFVVWRRSVALAMTRRIETTMGREWPVALARTPHFAEYVLYGLFAEHVEGLDAAGLRKAPRSLCLSRWTREIAEGPEEAAFVAALTPEHVACVVQSTIPMAEGQRARILRTLSRLAQAQDAQSAPLRARL